MPVWVLDGCWQCLSGNKKFKYQMKPVLSACLTVCRALFIKYKSDALLQLYVQHKLCAICAPFFEELFLLFAATVPTKCYQIIIERKPGNFVINFLTQFLNNNEKGCIKLILITVTKHDSFKCAQTGHEELFV